MVLIKNWSTQELASYQPQSLWPGTCLATRIWSRKIGMDSIMNDPRRRDHKGYPPKQSKNLGVWFLLPVSHQEPRGLIELFELFQRPGKPKQNRKQTTSQRAGLFYQKIIKNEDQSPVWRCIQLPLAPPRFRHITAVHNSLLSLTVPNSLAWRMLEVRKWLCTFNRWDMGIWPPIQPQREYICPVWHRSADLRVGR